MAIEQSISPDTAQSFGNLLKEHREAYQSGAGISRNQLAHDVGVDPSYLTRIEHGDREPPRIHIVGGLARKFNLRGSELLEFYMRAGYLPESVQSFARSNMRTLAQVIEFLSDNNISEEKNDLVSQIIQASINLAQSK